MLRRLTAILIFHFLLCVGISASGLNVPSSAPQWAESTDPSVYSHPGTPDTFPDASDHALMDDKGDFPDQLEVLAHASVDAVNALAAVPGCLRSARAHCSPTTRHALAAHCLCPQRALALGSLAACHAMPLLLGPTTCTVTGGRCLYRNTHIVSHGNSHIVRPHSA